MIDTIRKAVDGIPGLSGWKIEMSEIEGMEAYLLRDELEMGRGKNTALAQTTLYVDSTRQGVKFRGAASVTVFPGTPEDELTALVKRAAEAAGYAPNPWFPLAEPGSRIPDSVPGSGVSSRLESLAPDLLSVKNTDDGRISYAELILTGETGRVINSEGVDAVYRTERGYLELSAIHRGADREEVEVFDSLRFSDPVQGLLRRFLSDTLARARERAAAGPVESAVGIPVILTGAALQEFFSYFLFHTSACNIYRKLSASRIGENIQGEAVAGDSITLSILPSLRGSPWNRGIDTDGVALSPHTLIRNGMIERLAGDIRHAYYLSIPPTGNQTNFSVSPGSVSREGISGRDRLEVTDFSDFQMDPVTGTFGGEFRLAYLYSGSGKKPVTNGSISGVMGDCAGSMGLSSDIIQRENYEGPSFVRLDTISVSGR